MRKFVLALPLCLSLVLSLGGCGSGGGSSSAGGSGTGSANTVTAAGTVRLAWDAPASSSGTAISNISGYNVHYGTSSRNYDKTINNGSQTICTVSGLAPGTYYFAVTSYDAAGNESPFSNEVSKFIQ